MIDVKTSNGVHRLGALLVIVLGAGGCGGATGGAPATTSGAAATTHATTGAGGGASSTGAGGAQGKGGAAGAGGGAADAGPVDKSAACAPTFGSALTNAFGRLDGVVLAVVKPEDKHCAMWNGTHLVIEVSMNGAVYREVVNVQSDYGDPRAQFLAIDHPMPAPAWSEGWHTGVAVDYPTTFGVHSNAFTPTPMPNLIETVDAAVTIGQKVSVYSTSSGGASAHLVHRNGGNTDGAIVLDPDGPKPRLLLFHFPEQVF